MTEQVRATRIRAPKPEEEQLHSWFQEQEKDPSKNLEEAARQIIQLVSTLYAVIFGIVALAANPVPAYLAQANVRALDVLAVLGYLAALLAALVVVVPSAYRYARASQTQRKDVFDTIMRRKVTALRLALLAFAVGSVGFAALFLVVLFGW
jgi:hypothetical protein